MRNQIKGCELLKNTHRVGCAQHSDCASETNTFGKRSARSEDDRRRRIEKLRPVMFTDAKHVQTHLVGKRNLFEQMMHALRGSKSDTANGVWNGCCKAVNA